MKIPKWYLFLTVLLLVLSAGFYALQVAVFHKPHDTFFYMLQDLAFVPIQVLVGSLRRILVLSHSHKIMAAWGRMPRS